MEQMSRSANGSAPKICSYFGATAEAIEEWRKIRLSGSDVLPRSPRLASVVDCLASGMFSPDDTDRFRDIVDALRGYDHFMVAADFEAYWNTHREIDAAWRRPEEWWRKSILNTARMSYFSADRTVREYAADIWNIPVG